MKKIITVFLAFLVIQVSAVPAAFAETFLKIGLKYGKSSLSECYLASESGFYGFLGSEIIFTADESTLDIRLENGAVNIYGQSGGVCYYTLLELGSSIEIAPADYEKIKFNGSLYRGSMLIENSENGIKVINCVELENYLKSVVPSEMPSGWHIEALKAQAICARNYALSNIGKYKSYGFDMDDTTSNQVYKGISSENENTTKAVQDTAGIYLMHDEKLVQTFFFSSGAGSTEDVKNVWGSEIPYLKSVEVPGEEIRDWEKIYTKDELTKRLENMNINIGNVKSVEITKRSTTGRVTEVVITGDCGSYTASLEKARTVFGLNSAFYEISGSYAPYVAPDLSAYPTYIKGAVLGKSITEHILKPKHKDAESSEFVFKGKGSGHAVGLSQYGAKALAEQGYTYEEILTHFYTDSYLEKN